LISLSQSPPVGGTSASRHNSGACVTGKAPRTAPGAGDRLGRNPVMAP
jgi:hypothetical protein